MDASAEGAHSMNIKLDGTFDFCATCAANNNCCVRTRHNYGQVANPPLLPHEGEMIAAVTGLGIDEFTESTVPEGNGLAIKRAGAGGYFYQGGRCAIYSARPFDCRIFPFDVIEHEGELHWIVYTNLCPVDFDYNRYLASAKEVLRDSNVSEEELVAFTRHGRDVMAPHPFRVLEPVVLGLLREKASV